MRLFILVALCAGPAFAQCDIQTALMTLRPGAEWILRGKTYEGLEWLDREQTKPTKTAVSTAMTDCLVREAAELSYRAKCIQDAKDKLKTPAERLDALIEVIELK